MTLRIAPFAAALLLAACGEPVAEGQVLAVVNGHEITERDLAAEGGSADRATALRQLVDRHLLAEVAREQSLERTPEYLAALRRNREQLLVQGLGQKLSATMPDPSAADISGYIAAHPHAFIGRVVAELKDPRSGSTVTLDTARMGPRPGSELARKKPGEQFGFGGTMLEVIAIRAAPLTGPDARMFAEQSLRAERLDAEVGKVLAERRAKASISYNK